MRRAIWCAAFVLAVSTNGRATAADVVDASTLTGTVMCGYQGWFNAPADGAGRGWVHWGHGAMRPGTATVDLWPDVTELTPAERFPTDFQLAPGRPAEVFSSYRPATVARHFRWVPDYGIDGVWLQRFASGIGVANVVRQDDRVLRNVRDGARASGRVHGLMYDLSGLRDDEVDKVAGDWRRLVAGTKLTADPRYVRDGGRPVVGRWGYGFGDGRDPLTGGGGRRAAGGGRRAAGGG